MKLSFSAMEFFGSRADEPVGACEKEIEECDILVGIYAWRYGWSPSGKAPSVTELEFSHAQTKGKKCLCYLVDESHSWPPIHMDGGRALANLKKFKARVSGLVRSKFTTPDNLAKQVAADVAREVLPKAPAGSFGGLLQVNWDVFSPDLQKVLETAYAQARVESTDGVVATRHVFAALASTENSGNFIVNAFPKVKVPQLLPRLREPEMIELFGYKEPVSSCVLASMKRLLPAHSPTQRLLAVELAVDLLKYGHGSSVIDYRRAGIDAALKMIRKIAANDALLRKVMGTMDEAAVIHLAYICNVAVPKNAFGLDLIDVLLDKAKALRLTVRLAGELARRHPELLNIN
jgi:hypothetical protein